VLAQDDDDVVHKISDGLVLQVEVANFDTESMWRHSGGAEDWVVRKLSVVANFFGMVI
jgi:hypothetical protein